MDLVDKILLKERDRLVQLAVDTESGEEVRCGLKNVEKGMDLDGESNVGNPEAYEEFWQGDAATVVVSSPVASEKDDAVDTTTSQLDVPPFST